MVLIFAEEDRKAKIGIKVRHGPTATPALSEKLLCAAVVEVKILIPSGNVVVFDDAARSADEETRNGSIDPKFRRVSAKDNVLLRVTQFLAGGDAELFPDEPH